MRVPQRSIVALCGPSRVGKTVVARQLSQVLSLPLRSCGEEVKQRAEKLGVDWKELSDSEHATVDRESIAWAAASRPCLIEGRYLDRVLWPVRVDVILVALKATTADRLARSRGEGLDQPTSAEFHGAEKLESAFIERMYGIDSIDPALVLNSSQLSVETCVQLVRDLIVDQNLLG